VEVVKPLTAGRGRGYPGPPRSTITVLAMLDTPRGPALLGRRAETCQRIWTDRRAVRCRVRLEPLACEARLSPRRRFRGSAERREARLTRRLKEPWSGCGSSIRNERRRAVTRITGLTAAQKARPRAKLDKGRRRHHRRGFRGEPQEGPGGRPAIAVKSGVDHAASTRCVDGEIRRAHARSKPALNTVSHVFGSASSTSDAKTVSTKTGPRAHVRRPPREKALRRSEFSPKEATRTREEFLVAPFKRRAKGLKIR